MKKIKLLIIFLIQFFLYNFEIKAQNQVQIELEILQDISQMDLTVFLNFGKGNFDALNIPLVLQITMDYPEDDEMILSGNVQWNSPDGKKNGQLIAFSSHPFKGIKILTNKEFNQKIIFQAPDLNDDLIEENTKRGKPSGKYTINLTLLDTKTNQTASTTKIIEITNPTQTFYIQSPSPLSSNDIGSVIAMWDAVIGAKYYKILANVRSSKKISLEEALNSANPLINNKNVGLNTSVNLADLLDRQWLPGQEIVFRVAAVIPSTSGDTEINSANIVNFFITSSDSYEGETISKNFSDVLNNVINDLKGNFDEEDENLNMQNVTGKQLLDMIEKGQLNFSNLIITDESGRIITYDELNNLLNYLRSNPNALISLNYQSN